MKNANSDPGSYADGGDSSAVWYKMAADLESEKRAAGEQTDEAQEKLERELRENIIEACESKYSKLAICYSNASETLERSGFWFGERTGEDVLNLYKVNKNYDLEKTDALLAFIDAVFPDTDGVGHDVSEARDDFLSLTQKKCGMRHGVYDDMNRVLRIGNDDYLNTLSNFVELYSDGQDKTENDLAKAYIDYIENPTDQTRKALESARTEENNQNKHNLGRIVDIMGNVRDKSVQELQDILMNYQDVNGLSSEEYHDAVMKYIDFKIEKGQQSVIEQPGKNSIQQPVANNGVPADDYIPQSTL